MHAVLTPENTASEEVLKRTLLASAVWRNHDDPRRLPGTVAVWLGDRAVYGYNDESVLREELLDALLAGR